MKSALSAALSVWEKVHARHTLPVVGWSMWPLLRPGDSVVVQHGGEDVRIGDLVVYRRGGQVIVHRLIHVRAHQGVQLLYFRGDNRPYPDPPVHPADVVGRVVAIRRGERTWQVQGPAWRICGLLLSAAMRPLVRGRHMMQRLVEICSANLSRSRQAREEKKICAHSLRESAS